MKKTSILIAACLVVGCARGQIDIIDADENIVGQCSANFYGHWYGAQDSVDYILHICAKEQVAKGFRISDESILDNDYTLPTPPQGAAWNKRTAKQEFNGGNISEKQYGYVLAAIEYEFWLAKGRAEKQLEAGVIDEEEYERELSKAEDKFEG